MLKYGTSTHKAHTVLLLESTAYIFGPLKNGMETFFWPLLYIKLEVSTDRLKPKSAAFYLGWPNGLTSPSSPIYRNAYLRRTDFVL